MNETVGVLGGGQQGRVIAVDLAQTLTHARAPSRSSETACVFNGIGKHDAISRSGDDAGRFAKLVVGYVRS